MSLGGLAQLAAGRGEAARRARPLRRVARFLQAIGDRGEEARILTETAAAYLANGDAELARRYFFESVQAHTDVASGAAWAISLVGLAAVGGL